MEKTDFDKYSLAYKVTWDLFHIHAKQRIYFFNFFIIILSALVTLQVDSILKDLYSGWMGFGLGILQSILCFIFYKLDNRNKFLTKHSEKVIIKFEELFEFGDYAVMKTQEEETNKIREKECKCQIFTKQYSFSKLINLVYMIFVLASIGLSIFAIL